MNRKYTNGLHNAIVVKLECEPAITHHASFWVFTFFYKPKVVNCITQVSSRFSVYELFVRGFASLAPIDFVTHTRKLRNWGRPGD